jgi:hypothetical protein
MSLHPEGQSFSHSSTLRYGVLVLNDPPARYYPFHYAPMASDLTKGLGRGAMENKHLTDVEFPPPHPRVCESIHTECKTCSDLIRVILSMTLLIGSLTANFDYGIPFQPFEQLLAGDPTRPPLCSP